MKNNKDQSQNAKRIVVFSGFIVLLIVLFWLNFTWRPWEKPTQQREDILVSNTPTPTPSYVNSKLKFSLDLPSEFKVEENGEYSITITPDKKIEGQGPVNFIYISVVPKDVQVEVGEIYNYNQAQYNKLLELEIGESVSLSDASQPKLKGWFTYTRGDDVTIDGKPVKKLQNKKPWEFPAGTVENRYILESNGTLYILGFYFGSTQSAEINEETAFKIISTLKLQ